MGKSSRRKNIDGAGVEPEKRLKRPEDRPIKSAGAVSGLLFLLPVIILGIAVYSNSVKSPFQFDDGPYIADNPLIKNLGYFLSSPPELLSIIYIKTRYLTHLTFAINYALGGLNVTWYHIFNICVHITNALLVYMLVRLTLSPAITPLSGSPKNAVSMNRTAALFSALLFVCHPIEVQAVTYITQRFASFTTFFYLLATVLYITARSKQSGGAVLKSWLPYYLFAIAATVLAMKTKEISFTIPFVIALYEFMFFQGPVGRRIICLAPFFLTLPIIPLAMLSSGGPTATGDLMGNVSEAARSLSPLSRTDYLFTQFRVITTYIRLLLFPINQNLDYDYPLYHSLLQLPVFLSFLFILSLLLSAVVIVPRYNRVSPYAQLVSFGILWFLITLSVESSIIPISDVIFEHRVYLPSIGAIIAVTAVLFIIRTRLEEIKPQFGRAVIPVFACLVLAFSTAAFARNRVWQDDVILWKDVVSKSPLKERGHNNLGAAYSSKEMPDEAIDQYKATLKIQPDHAEAHNNLATVYLKKGAVDDAAEHLKAALTINPGYADAHSNLGAVLLKKGLFDEAISELETAVRLRRSLTQAHSNLGAAYVIKGQLDKAISEYRIALDQDPGNTTVHFNLANAYFKKGMYDDSVAEYRTVLGKEPGNATAHYAVGLAYTKKGAQEEAKHEFEEALKLSPGDNTARIALENLGKLP